MSYYDRKIFSKKLLSDGKNNKELKYEIRNLKDD